VPNQKKTKGDTLCLLQPKNASKDQERKNLTGDGLMLEKDFIKMLACPETKKPLTLAPADLTAKVNKSIEKGDMVNRTGQKITQKVDGGLILEEESTRFYPIRNGYR